jgi:predicted dehydrogenase
MLSVLGPWHEVTAVANRLVHETNTEDVSAALVTFEDGTVASVVNSLLSPRETSYLRFDFEHATVELAHLYGYDDAHWTATGAPGYEQAIESLWCRSRVGTPSGHSAQFAAVLVALDGSQPPPVTSADARSTMELVAAIYASAFTRRPMRRGEVDRFSPFHLRMAGDGAPWPDRK